MKQQIKKIFVIGVLASVIVVPTVHAKSKGIPEQIAQLTVQVQSLLGLKNDVASLNQDVTTVKSDLATVKTDNEALKTELTKVKQDEANTGSDVNNLKQQVAALQGQVQNLQGLVTQQQQTITSQQQQIDTLKNNVSYITPKMILTVYDNWNGNKPLAGKTVTLTGSSKVLTGVTDSNGQATFEVTLNGVYTYKVDGYDKAFPADSGLIYVNNQFDSRNTIYLVPSQYANK